MISFIKKLIERFNQKKKQYVIKDLYCGEIEYCFSRDVTHMLVWPDYFVPKQKFAILVDNENNRYFSHISKNREIVNKRNAYAGDYCVEHLRPFAEEFADLMKEKGLTSNSLLSRYYIQELEETKIKELLNAEESISKIN